jgi:chitodextrinase
MLWVILGVLALIGLLVWNGYYLGWAWGDPIPPPPPTPFITSAIATGRDTIHLILSKGSGQVAIERSQPENPSTTPDVFSTLSNELDDTGLQRDTLYSYRARYTAPLGPWSPPKEARTHRN